MALGSMILLDSFRSRDNDCLAWLHYDARSASLVLTLEQLSARKNKKRSYLVPLSAQATTLANAKTAFAETKRRFK